MKERELIEMPLTLDFVQKINWDKVLDKVEKASERAVQEIEKVLETREEISSQDNQEGSLEK